MKNQTLIERVLELENDISVIVGMLSELRMDVREKNEMAYEYGLEVYINPVPALSVSSE